MLNQVTWRLTAGILQRTTQDACSPGEIPVPNERSQITSQFSTVFLSFKATWILKSPNSYLSWLSSKNTLCNSGLEIRILPHHSSRLSPLCIRTHGVQLDWAKKATNSCLDATSKFLRGMNGTRPFRLIWAGPETWVSVDAQSGCIYTALSSIAKLSSKASSS
jgi:hypothetical protein